MKIKKGDQVRVICGKDRGKSGKVLRVMPEDHRILVEGVNMIHRHSRPSQKNPRGGIVEKEGTIHVSNVMLIDGRVGAPTRVGFRLIEDKDKRTVSKVRVSLKSGEII